MGNPSNLTQVIDLSSSGQLLPFDTYEEGTANKTGTGTKLIRLKPLTGAANEINMVSNFYGNEVEKLTGPNATKAEFQRIAERYRIIHFATHGILNSKRPMDSSIVLESGRPERANDRSKINTSVKNGSDKLLIISNDQLLSAREVMEMRLQAELVVLSACDTAGGGISEGEGMIGLTWAFAAAGVPTIVASQWAVPDKTTADLMEDFHQRLQRYSQKDRSVRGTAAALTEAARAIAGKREYRHPYYWAAFIVVGNGQ
jgi:CHAT domain-containing protein